MLQRIIPDCHIISEEQLGFFDVNRIVTEGRDQASERWRKLRV